MEELKLEVTSNLDELLKQVRQLKKENANLGTSYKKLQEQVSNSSKGLKSSFNELNNVNRVVERFKNVTEEAQKKNDEAWSSGVAKLKEFHQSYKNLQNAVVSGSVRLSSSVARLSSSMTPMSPADIGSGFSLSPTSLFGTTDAVKNAFSLMKEMQQMRHDLAYLSNSAGNAGEALSTVFSIASGSAISRGTATGVVRALADQGLQLYDSAGKVSPRIEKLGKLSGDLQAATGIAASQWAAFTGELSANYQLPEEGITSITSALVGTGLSAQNLERAMSTVNKVLTNTAYVAGVPTDESMKGLTRTIGGAMKVMTGLGLSAEKAGSTIENMLDPENFEKNSYLFAKLGISTSEYADYLNQANGQQLLLQKVMSNLPQLAKEIASMRNPFARIQIAKSLGLDMQLVQRMANASGEELQRIQAEYESQNKNQEALEKKKKFMAAESAKFDDYLFSLKMKVLSPIMQMLSSGMLSDFMGVLPTLAESMAKTFVAVTPIAKVLADAFVTYSPLVFKFATLMADVVGMLFGPAGLGVTGTPIQETVSRAYDSATKRLNETGVDFASILSVLSKIYLAVKAFQFANFFVSTAKSLGGFVGAGIEKVLGWISPRQKLVMNATVGDLADAIKTSVVQPGTGSPLSTIGNLLSPLLLALAGVGFGSLLFKAIFGGISTKELDDLANYGTQQGLQKVESEARGTGFKTLGERGFQIAGGTAALIAKPMYQAVTEGFKAFSQGPVTSTVVNPFSTYGATETVVVSSASKRGFDVFKGTLGKTVGQNFVRGIAAPLAGVIAGVDVYQLMNSEKTGAALWFERAGTAMSVGAAAALAAAIATSWTGYGGIGAGMIAGFLATGSAIAKGAAEYVWQGTVAEARQKAFTEVFGEPVKTALQGRQMEVTGVKETLKTYYGQGVGANLIKERTNFTTQLEKASVETAKSFEEYNQLNQQKLFKALSPSPEVSFPETEQTKIKNFFAPVDNEEFLKQRLTNAKLSLDSQLYEQRREDLKKVLLDNKKTNDEAEKALIDAGFKTAEEYRAKQYQDRLKMQMETVKTGEAMGGLFKAFKIGDMNSFISLITIFIQKFKVAILEFILSIPGVGSGRVNEMAASWLGDDYKKVVAKVYVGEDELRKQLNKFIEDKNEQMDTVLQEVEKKAKLADEKQKKDELAERARALKAQEANTVALNKATESTKENTKVLQDRVTPGTVSTGKRDFWAGTLGGVGG